MAHPSLTRRSLLRASAAGLVLPWLEAFAPARGAKDAFPRRLVFVYVPNGIRMDLWTPAGETLEGELPPTLQPLAPYREDLLVLSGLAHAKARANGDGPGDHARAAATFLTATQARKTGGPDIQAGISIDQVAAASLGAHTRFRSLELGCEGSRQSGDCDSGYACAYSTHLAWSSPSTPLAKETDPRALFDRLFLGGRSAEERARIQQRSAAERSILDWVEEDTRRLAAKLGREDRGRLEEFQQGVRELERRLAALAEERPPDLDPALRPAARPDGFAAQLAALYDVLALALATDSTRIATFLVTNEGSNRSYPEVDVPEGHHEISHHGDDPEKLAKVGRINLFHTQALATFLERLRQTREGDGDLLANSAIVYGSAIADGNRHDHHDLPLLLLGSAGGRIRSGRHLRYPSETPAANFFLALLEHLGAPVARFGDSTGRLEGLART